MNVMEFFRVFFQYIAGLCTQLNKAEILPGVGYLDLTLGFIVIALVISVFWKGARV